MPLPHGKIHLRRSLFCHALFRHLHYSVVHALGLALWMHLGGILIIGPDWCCFAGHPVDALINFPEDVIPVPYNPH